MVVQRSAVVQRAGARSAYALPAQTAKAPRLDLRASIDPPAAGWVVDLILRILLSQPAHVCPCRRQLVRVCSLFAFAKCSRVS